jgi:UDP-N-acetylmuramate--alanine ligase
MQHIHLIGIGGTGLSAIALLLKERGYIVSGSDRALSPLAAGLQRAGISVFVGHKAENITGADLVVRSSAVHVDNPEVQAALAAGIPVLRRQEFLGQLMSDLYGIAVAGTHGKTTTSAMLAWCLYALDQDPSYILGGVAKNLHGNAHAGQGKYFVIEADEYDRMFLGLKPQMAVLTIVEHDHPDCYPTLAEYQQAFTEFVATLPAGGLLLAHQADAAAMSLPVPQGVVRKTYGMADTADYRAVITAAEGRGGYSYDFFIGQAATAAAHVDLQVPGRHNVLNSLAVLAVIDLLGLPVITAAQALGQYLGAGRRFDILGEANGVTVIDDYGHHPTEIKATLEAARTRYPDRRIWAVWQPHTFSRTQALMNEFVQSFIAADHVLVTEVYAARESDPDFSAAQVVEKIQQPAANFCPTFRDAIALLNAQLVPGDVLIVLSAGDADQISAAVLAEMRKKEQAHA